MVRAAVTDRDLKVSANRLYASGCAVPAAVTSPDQGDPRQRPRHAYVLLVDAESALRGFGLSTDQMASHAQ